MAARRRPDCERCRPASGGACGARRMLPKVSSSARRRKARRKLTVGRGGRRARSQAPGRKVRKIARTAARKAVDATKETAAAEGWTAQEVPAADPLRPRRPITTGCACCTGFGPSIADARIPWFAACGPALGGFSGRLGLSLWPQAQAANGRQHHARCGEPTDRYGRRDNQCQKCTHYNLRRLGLIALLLRIAVGASCQPCFEMSNT